MGDSALPPPIPASSTGSSLHLSLFNALLAGLGDSAPREDSHRYRQAYVDLAVLVEGARDDKISFLSADVRDAVLSAIASAKAAERDFVGDVVRDGFHGYGLAADAEILGLAEQLDVEDILFKFDLQARAGRSRADLLRELSNPQAVEVISAGAFDPEDPEAMLMGSLSKALADHGHVDPYAPLTRLQRPHVAPVGSGVWSEEPTKVDDYLSEAPASDEPAMVTYWLYHGERLLTSKRLRAGLGAVDVRAAAAGDAVIFCDRPYESPASMRRLLLSAHVVVYDDRPAQTAARRELPYEYRALFPGEQPFFELAMRKQDGPSAAVQIASATAALQAVAAELSLGIEVTAPSPLARVVKVQQASGEDLAECVQAMKEFLDAAHIEVTHEFGVGYRTQPIAGERSHESEEEVERPRG
jgi:hypothetical protein